MVQFIADIGSNHNQDLGRCELLIKTAKDLGCWGVKFQMYRADLMYNLKDMPKDFHKGELKDSWLHEIRRMCHAYGINFGCSPFYIQAVKKLTDWDVDFLKIASYEITRPLLIKKCAETKLPVMISTGLATVKELSDAIGICHSVGNKDIILYHCCAEYPAPISHCELVTIKLFRDSILSKKMIQGVGWSDHSHEPGIIYKAISNGADWIEFHLDLDDMHGWESKYGHCWRPDEIKQVINDVRKGERADALSIDSKLNDLRKQRADPSDGMRPYKEVRK